jgi:small subunit ribosomal protein S17
VITGTVVSDKMNRTITVEQERRVRHPRYGKIVRRKTRYKAHDENNDARTGDVVEIMQTRPLSATKRWRLVRIVRATRREEEVAS